MQEEGVRREAGFGRLSKGQQEMLVKRLVRLMLCRNMRKRPVRREDMRKHVFEGAGSVRGRYVLAGVIKGAQRELRRVFGMEMVEVSRLVRQTRVAASRSQMTQSQAVGGGGGRGYVVVSCLGSELRAEDAKGKAELGFLMVVAGMIALEGGCRMEQGKLYQGLERLGCRVWEKGGHRQLNGGNVKELLEKVLVGQWYLEREREDGVFYYTIGPRFRAEISDEDLIGFVDAVYGLGGDKVTLDEMSRQELKLKLEHSRGEGLEEGEADAADGMDVE